MKIEDMTVEQLQAEYDSIEAKLGPLFEQQATINKQIIALRETQKKVEERKGKMQYEAMQASDQVDWALLLDAGPSGDRHYREVILAMRQVAPSNGIEFSGYFPETQQHALRVKFTRGNEQQVEEAAKVLETLVPLYKPLPDYHGWLIFSIFESTLSEWGSYKFAYNPGTKKWYCGRWRSYNRYKQPEEFATTWDQGPFDTAKEVMTCVCENYPYEAAE
jgi:hypothetical protein